LIEEARQRRRQRSRRRKTVVVAAAVLAVLGFGIDQLARGGSSVDAASPSPGAATAPTSSVTYEKIVALKIVPHLPVEKKTIETWSASGAPDVYRQVVTIAGGPRLEIGAAPGYGQVLGPERVGYLYDRASRTIYRTGVTLVPNEKPLTPEQMFNRALAEPGVRRAGTRTYRGRGVYVLAFRNKDVTGTVYVDKKTYEPMMSDERSADLHIVVRTLAFETLPPTKANLALTSLRTAHPQAHVVLHASPHIKALFGMAAFPSGDYGSG
jgi:hypothetical protein